MCLVFDAHAQTRKAQPLNFKRPEIPLPDQCKVHVNGLQHAASHQKFPHMRREMGRTSGFLRRDTCNVQMGHSDRQTVPNSLPSSSAGIIVFGVFIPFLSLFNPRVPFQWTAALCNVGYQHAVPVSPAVRQLILES
jgi:hypothetical protein